MGSFSAMGTLGLSRQQNRWLAAILLLLVSATLGAGVYLVAHVDAVERAALVGSAAGRALLALAFLLGATSVLVAWSWRRGQRALIERLALATRYAQDGVILAELDGRIVEANEAAVQIHGRPLAELLQMRVRDLRTPECRDQAPDEQLKTVGAAARFEVMRQRPDGSRFPAEVSARVVAIGGRLYRMEITHDITERLAAANQARESEARLRFALESCGIGAWDMDLVDQTAFRSPEHDRIFGYEQPLSSWTLEDFLAHALPSYREPVRQMVQAATAARTGWTQECEIRRADGAIRWIWFTGRHYTDRRGHDRVVGVVQDITERKKAEERERRSRQLLAEAEALAHTGAWEWDVVADRFEFSAEWLRIHGCQQPPRTAAELLPLAHPEDRERVAAAFAQLQQGTADYDLEHRIVRADNGAVRYAQAQGHSEKQDGRVVRVHGFVRDITESKQAEAALRASEEQFRSLIEASPQALLLVGADGRIHLINRQAELLFGWSRAELLGQSVERLVPKHLRGDHQQHRQQFAAAPAARPMGRGRELFACRKDGTLVPVEIGLAPVPTSAGQFTLATVTDITLRHRAEQQLRVALAQAEEGQRLLTALLEYLPMGITIADAPDVNIRAVSRYGQALTGQPREQILGIPAELHAQRWRILRRDGRTPATNEELPLTRATRQGEIVREEEFVLERPDGTQVPILCSAAPIRDPQGQITGGVIGWQDITASKRAEEAVRQAEERLRLATEATGIGIFDYNLRDGELLWLANARHHFGLGFETPVDYAMFLRGLHPEDRDRVDQLVQAVLGGTNQGRYRTEYRTIGLEDGRQRWLDARGQVLFDADGQAVRFVGVTLDITQRKQMEAELRGLTASLEQRVAERTAELTAAVQELEGFTYTVAHDLRAPLRHVHGFIELLARSLAGRLSLADEQNIGRIRQAAVRMQHLVDGLLDFARLGRTGLERTAVALGPLIASVRDQLQPEAGDRQVQWRIGELPRVWGDERLLRQVFFNLLDNALKFTRPRTPAVIEIRASQPGANGQVLVEVRDNGVGFDMRYAGKLFGVFQRLHDQSEFEGTGIGLAHVQRIIQRHGGQVRAESEPGVGTTIQVSLPVAG